MTTLAPTSNPMPMAWKERMNQNAKKDGESRIHVLIPLSSIVLKINGTAKCTSYKAAGGDEAQVGHPIQPQESCQRDRGTRGRRITLDLAKNGKNNDPSVASDIVRRLNETKFSDCDRSLHRTLDLCISFACPSCNFGRVRHYQAH